MPSGASLQDDPTPSHTVKWSHSQESKDNIVQVILFQTSYQCECFNKNAKCTRHAKSSGKNYTTLVENVLWAFQSLRSVPCQSQCITVKFNISLHQLEQRMYADSNDYRHMIHQEAAAEAEILTFLVTTKCSIVFQKVESTDQWHSEPQDNPIYLPDKVSLMYDGHPSYRYKDLLLHFPAGHKYWQYLFKKYDFTVVWDSIDWLDFCHAMPKYSNWSLAFIEMLHGWLATSENVRKCSPYKIQCCPFCNESETTSHLFQCQSKSRRQEICRITDDMWKQAASLLGAPITEALQVHLRAWIDNEDIELKLHKELLQQQYAIRWSQFAHSRIAVQI